MSKDVLVDVDILKDHPKRINKLIEKIIEEIEKLRSEGYELYTLTTQKGKNCSEQINVLSNEYRTVNRSEMANRNDSKSFNFKDSQEQDFYSAEAKKKYEMLENKMQRYTNCKAILDDSAQQVVNIKKTVDDLKQKSEKWNKIYTITIDSLIDLI